MGTRMHRPVRTRLAGAASALILTVGLAGPAAAEDFGPYWPEGETAVEVGYFCQACHSLSIITQQGLDRGTWDDVLQWMIEDHGMPELEAEEYERYLTFLTENFGPESHDARQPTN